jgi:cytochrome oxidase Cu insertion factor (SCO1/SenC/PrrC family)
MSVSRTQFRILRYLIALLAGAAAGLAAYLIVGLDAPSSGGPTRTTGRALIGGSFELVDQNGKTRTDAEFRGKYMLVFFGYTHCPDVCPTGLQAMAEALDALGKDAEQIQPIFITVDPARDTPAVMKDYVGNFHPRLLGLTGSAAQIAKAAKAYRVYYARAGKPGDEDYAMDHSSFTYLMGPDGKYLTHFSHGTAPKKVAERIRKLMK